jgi:myo-inositol-1(or 4)-monophosphatase
MSAGSEAALRDARDAARFAAALAEKTGELLLRYFREGSVGSRLKEDYSIVTEADVAADHLIADAIGRTFPQDAIVSEELAPTSSSGSRCTWIVDPLDGTTNFSLGVQHWGVSIARCDEEGPDVSALCFPALGELFVASRGGGATLNGEPARVRVPAAPRQVGMIASCARTPRHFHVNVPMKVRVFGSAAYTLALVAKGSAAIGVETTPKIWDIAAGWLLVREAGGEIETTDGSVPFPLATDREYAARSFPVRAAASPALLQLARDHIELR